LPCPSTSSATAFAIGHAHAEPLDPCEIDAGRDHPGNHVVRSAHRQDGNDRGRPLQAPEHIIADEGAGAQNLAEMPPVRKVEAYCIGKIGAGDPAVVPDELQGLDPRHVGDLCDQSIAGLRGSRRIAVGDDLEHGVGGENDLLLRFDASAGKADRLLGGGRHAIDALGLEQPDAVDEQRRNRQGGQHEQPAADAQARFCCCPGMSRRPICAHHGSLRPGATQSAWIALRPGLNNC
jgi:hypothetical protein